jgi:hypothetical protein
MCDFCAGLDRRLAVPQDRNEVSVTLVESGLVVAAS